MPPRTRRCVSAVLLAGAVALTGITTVSAADDVTVPNPDQLNTRVVGQQLSDLVRQGVDGSAAQWMGDEWITTGVSKIIRLGLPPANQLDALCFSATDPVCREKTSRTGPGTTSTETPNMNVFLGPCISAADVGCIESMAVGTDGQPVVDATFVSSMATDLPELPENAKMRVPRGSTAGVWRTPSGRNYMVRVVLFGPLQRNYDTKGRLMSPVFDPRKINMTVDPVTVTDLQPGTVLTERQKTWSRSTVLANGTRTIENNTGMCTPTQCLTATTFGSDERIRLAVRVPDGLETWLTGRIDDAVVRTQRLGSNRTRLTVEGDALATQHAGGAVPTASLPPDLHSKYWCRGRSTCDKSIGLNGENGYGAFLALEPYLGLRSSLTRTRWEVANGFNVIVGEGGVGADCLGLDTGLVGIVGTNAAVYSSDPPTWTAESGQLSFRIASPHLDADGKVTVGRYTLAIPPSVAQCLYGRSALPPTVEVSVTEDNGTTRTETVAVSRDANWVRFAVSGFTFSAPRITVKLGVGTSVKVGGTLGVSALRSAAGLPARARPSVSVTKSSAKVCEVRGTSVSALKKGVCVVKVRNGSATQTLAVLVRNAKAGSGQSVRGTRY